MQVVKNLWLDLAGRYSNDHFLIEDLWKEIEQHYSTSSRPYHNLKHLEFMLKLALQYRDQIKDPDSLMFAIFYHDFIYEVGNKNNEQKSADMASERLAQLGLSDEKIKRVSQQVVATRHHQTNGDSDTRFLLDSDLAVLGAEAKAYQEYARNIQKEYSRYTGFLYRRGRQKVLQYFLDRERIFHTDDFHRKYEQQARHNLQQEILSL